MALHIVTAEERLAEANSKTTLAIFGPPGIGKTSLLWSLLGPAYYAGLSLVLDRRRST